MAGVNAPFFDVKEARNGLPFLVVSQIRSEDQGQNRQSVVIFPDQLQGLLKAVKECMAQSTQKLADQVDKLAAAGEKIGRQPAKQV